MNLMVLRFIVNEKLWAITLISKFDPIIHSIYQLLSENTTNTTKYRIIWFQNNNNVLPVHNVQFRVFVII